MNKKEVLTSEQKRRYSRNIMLEEIGTEGQKSLLSSKIAVVGSGALGSIASLYLAGSGIGTIAIADFDTVDISNLQRQVAFSEEDTGLKKVLATANRMRALNSEITVIPVDAFLTPKNIEEFVSQYDVVIEGSDNPDTKYLVSQSCEKLHIPYCIAGVSQFYGQIMSWRPGCLGYKDIFPQPAQEGDYLPCSLGGVCGPFTGVIGSLQAVEAIKILLEIGEPLYNRMIVVDSLKMSFREVKF